MILDAAKKLAGSLDVKTLARALSMALDWKLIATEVAKLAVDRASKQKDQVLDVVAKEVSDFLERVNITEEGKKVLDGMTIEVTAKLSYDKGKLVKKTQKKRVKKTKQ